MTLILFLFRLEISLWKNKKRVSQILRFCCLGLNIALFVSLFVTALLDGIDVQYGAVAVGNIILAAIFLVIIIGFMVRMMYPIRIREFGRNTLRAGSWGPIIIFNEKN